jgi:glucosylceramidase
MLTAVKNPDGSIVVIVLNMSLKAKNFKLSIEDKQAEVKISPQAIQTIVLK